MLCLLLLIGADLSEVATRAAVLEASADTRIEVLSQLDVADLADYEAQRQLCGADGESCMAQLAGAYDARFVLFLRPYAVGGGVRISVVLRDLKKDLVVKRGDVTGADEASLFEAVRGETRSALASLVLTPEDARPRLFIAASARENVAVAAAAPAPAPAKKPTSALVWVGGITVALGAAALVGGGALWGIDYVTITDPNAGDFASKQSASDRYALLDPVLCLGGGVVAVAGGVVLGLGFME